MVHISQNQWWASPEQCMHCSVELRSGCDTKKECFDDRSVPEEMSQYHSFRPAIA